jgi:hypothetical protein
MSLVLLSFRKELRPAATSPGECTPRRRRLRRCTRQPSVPLMYPYFTPMNLCLCQFGLEKIQFRRLPQNKERKK